MTHMRRPMSTRQNNFDLIRLFAAIGGEASIKSKKVLIAFLRDDDFDLYRA